MPNWCSNEVTIEGTKEDMAKFVEECFTDFKGTPVLDFNKVMPEPDYNKPQKDGTHNNGVQKELHDVMPDWWNWRNTNWGTKWNLVPDPEGNLTGYEVVGQDDGFIQLEFETAWSPPNGIYNEIWAKYPDLTVSWFYREDGCQLAGWLPYD